VNYGEAIILENKYLWLVGLSGNNEGWRRAILAVLMSVNLLAECSGFRTLGKHFRCHTHASNGKIREVCTSQ